MMRSPNRGMKDAKSQLVHPEVSHIDAHHGLASNGFTHSNHFSEMLADAPKLIIEPPSQCGPAAFLTC